MKDRIKEIMESQHMNQQSFAAFIGIAPASLSSILQERTRPTLNTVEAIMKNLPDINLSWLISGNGPMFSPKSDGSANTPDVESTYPTSEGTLDFNSSENISEIIPVNKTKELNIQGKPHTVTVKKVDISKRQITEIRVFFDDQTWESFVPKK